MIIFNPKNIPWDQLTNIDILPPITEITSKQEAEEYLEAYAKYIHTMEIHRNKKTLSMDDARAIASDNIGYYTGYVTHEERRLIEYLFECSHPIFGSVEENGFPTQQEAFECGLKKITLKELREQWKITLTKQ